MDDKAKIRRINSYIDAYNRFDIDGMIEQLHEDVVFENHSNGVKTLETRGASEFRAQAEIAAGMFSERNQVVMALKVQGANFVAELGYQGVISRDLPNGLKAGERMNLLGTSEFAFRNGKIVSIVDRS